MKMLVQLLAFSRISSNNRVGRGKYRASCLLELVNAGSRLAGKEQLASKEWSKSMLLVSMDLGGDKLSNFVSVPGK